MTRRMFLSGFPAWRSDFNQQFYKETGCPPNWHLLRFNCQYSFAKMRNSYHLEWIKVNRKMDKFIKSQVFKDWADEMIKITTTALGLSPHLLNGKRSKK